MIDRDAATPHVRTIYGGHTRIGVTYEPDGPEIVACGESWCVGACGLPALVIPNGERALKAYSGAVACGALMQGFRVRWTGPRIEVPEAYREDFLRRMWW